MLKDKSDDEGNHKKIKNDKAELILVIEQLLKESRDLSYNQFKNDIKFGLEQQGEYERLRNLDKELNTEIK